FWPRRAQPAYAGFSDGQKDVSQNRAVNRTLDYTATATRDLTDNVSSATSFGLQYFARELQVATASGEQLPTPAVSTVSSAAVRSGEETFVENKTFGVFVQETVGWRDQLFVTAALRA